MRRKERSEKRSRRAWTRCVMSRETREASTTVRTLVSSRRSSNRSPRRERCSKCAFSSISWVSRVEFSVCRQFSLAPYGVGGALLGRRAQIGRRGADRSPGPPGEGWSPCGRLSRCGLAGASPNPRRARRPDVIFFRHDVPYTGRHRRRRAHGDRPPVAHQFVGRAPSRSLSS